MKRHLWTLLLILVCAAPLFLCLSLMRQFWAPDEPRYVQIAKEMVTTGNWLVPHINGELYLQKPPLFFWLLALSAKLFGRWDTVAMTFPSVCSAIGCLFVTYWFGAFSCNRRNGLLSAFILMSSLLYIGMAQAVRMDIFLVFCMLIELGCFYRLCTETTPHDRWYALSFYIAAALGTLTKGPIGLGLPGLIIVIFLLWTKQWHVLKRMCLLWGIPIYFLMVLAWFIPAGIQQGWDYVFHVVIEQSVGRATGALTRIHPRPWYFYLYTFPWISLPWFPFFIAATFSRGLNSYSPQEHQAVRLFWIWWFTTFFLFSLASGKLAIYLLPLLPATALLTGRYWDQVLLSRGALGESCA